MSCWCVRPISLPFTLTQSLRWFVFWCVSMGVRTVLRTDCCCCAAKALRRLLFSSLAICLARWMQTSSFAFKTYYKDKPFHHKCLWLLMWGLYTGACHRSPVPHVLSGFWSLSWKGMRKLEKPNLVIWSHFVEPCCKLSSTCESSFSWHAFYVMFIASSRLTRVGKNICEPLGIFKAFPAAVVWGGKYLISEGKDS